ncbi:MAG: hypothetical protein QOI25_3781, partial [Mycobacterium sp.]|nr:hypothetical protein [Mycobacterium sp.]
MALKKISLKTVLLAGAAVSAIAAAPLVSADPPPGCFYPDGTVCATVPDAGATAGPEGAGAFVPDAGATAGPDGANAVVPGAGATAGPEGANAVVPGAGATAGPEGAAA